jgi:phospholipase/carboxylesterase
MNRRRFGVLAGGAVGSLVAGDACRLAGEMALAGDGRLTARPRANGTIPLVVLLHGAGGRGDAIRHRFGTLPDELGITVLAPDSRGSSWDAIRGGFGPDVAFLDRELARVFDTVAVDPARTAIGGFSDGATYALSLGLINGDLFRKIIAFSPGFIVDGPPRGKPSIFISHGTADPILPIDNSSRLLVPALRRRGYPVTYREFDGRHQIPPEIARGALEWLAGRNG